MSPGGGEPEAGLCLSQPPAQLAEMRWWPMARLSWQRPAQGHLLAVTPAVGGLQPAHGPAAGPCVQTCLHIYQ